MCQMFSSSKKWTDNHGVGNTAAFRVSTFSEGHSRRRSSRITWCSSLVIIELGEYSRDSACLFYGTLRATTYAKPITGYI